MSTVLHSTIIRRATSMTLSTMTEGMFKVATRETRAQTMVTMMAIMTGAMTIRATIRSNPHRSVARVW